MACTGRPVPPRKGCRTGLQRIRIFAVPTLLLLACGTPGLLFWSGPARAWERAAAGKSQLQAGDEHQSAREAGEQLVLRQLLYRDRARQRDLELALEQLHQGDRVAGLSSLQKVLDGSHDVFLWEDTGELSSIRRQVKRIFRDMDIQTLRTYERLYEADADRRLAEARRSGGPADYREIVRRFFCTPAGFRAAEWLAAHHFDRGQFAEAGRIWRELLESGAHEARVKPSHVARAALALRLAGAADESSALEERLPDARIPIAGQPVSMRSWLSAERGRLDEFAYQSRRRAVASRGESPDATVPHLRPVWTAAHAEGGGAAAQHLVSAWHSEQVAGAQSLAVANHPVIVGGLAILRDFAGIRAFNLRTGETIWRYFDEGSLAKNAVSAGLSRGSSRLDVQLAYAANSALGVLTTDGSRLYAIGSMDLAAPDPSRTRNMFDRRSRVQLPESFRAGNRLIAIDLAAAQASAGEVQPVWTVGDETSDEASLSGHFFMGPPLPVGERLFAVTESNRQLNLICLESSSGRLLWTQPLSFVELPIDLDIGRFPLACTPSYAEGVLVCPTESELLVGVDADHGTLLWSYYYGDHPERRSLGRWPAHGRSGYGHHGFVNLPRIQGDRIAYVPRLSSQIHCIDAATGRQRWAVPREDAEYLGTVTDEVILAVGHRACRGLDPDTGKELWSLPLGMPSGRGVAAGDRYLLPLQEGRVATIDLLSGREVGLTGSAADLVPRGAPAGRERPTPGNLCAADGLIVSVDALGIAVYPQSAALLAQVREDLSRDPDNPSHHLLAAELEIGLGRLARGKTRLWTALSGTASAAERERGEHLLRELLYRELREQSAGEQRILTQLRQLARTPRERGRLLVETAEAQLRRGDPESALASVRSFARLDLGGPLRRTGDAAYLMSSESWIASAMRRIGEQLGDGGRDRLLVQAEIAQQQALNSEEIAELEAYLRLYADLPLAAAVRLELARRFIDRGASQRAELLLLQNRSSDDPVIAGSATRALAELWEAHGLYDEAAQLLAELDSRFAGTAIDGPLTGRDVLDQRGEDSMAKIALERRRGPGWPINNVAIRSVLWSSNDLRAAESFGRFRRRYETPVGSTFHLLDKGTQSESIIAAIGRFSGAELGRIHVPSAQHSAASAQNSHVGHFFPLGSPAALHGVSLLEFTSGKPLWTETPHEFGSRRDILRAGPAGPTFCTFQARQHLIAADPATGRTLWQRTDLDPGSGLVGDPYAGIFGDDEVLVVFGGDRVSYTVYRTATGEELRRGKLEVDTRQQRRVFGRKLCHVYRSPLGPRIRIWDPLIDRMVFDEPAGRRPLAPFVTHEDELAVIVGSPAGGGGAEHLKVIDVRAGELKIDVPLTRDELENLSAIRVFRNGERYFVNLQRSMTAPRERRVSSYLSDTFVDATHVNGDLLAIDAETGRVVWRRNLPQRSILQLSHLRLPFLIGLSRIGDRWRGTQSALAVEIVDVKTGQTLTTREDLFLDNRILYPQYDHREGRLELHGTRSVIELDFGRQLQRRPADEPL